MKHWMIALLFVSTLSPLASAVEITSPEIGSIILDVQDLGEPIDAPLVFKVSKKCKSHKSKLELVLDWKSICDWRPYDWNPITTVLTLNYSVSEIDKTTYEARCTGHRARDLVLREMCEN